MVPHHASGSPPYDASSERYQVFPARGTRWKLGLAMCSLGSLLIVAAPGSTTAQVFTPPRGEAQNVRLNVASGGVLHFDFDLISTDPRAVFTVLLEASRDGGATFTLRPESLSGDAGPGIVPGKGKRILWDSGKDVERIDIDLYRFRIVATAGALEPAPAPPTEPPPAVATPAVAAPIGKHSGGGAAKWLIPIGAGAGLAAILGGRGGADGSGPSAAPAATTAPDRFVLTGLSPPSGSTLPAATSTTGATATISYSLGSRDRAYLCVLPHFSASAPLGICRVQEVTRGTGVVSIGFAVQLTEPNLPVTTTRLEILAGDTPTFGASRFVSLFEPATFTWTRP